MTNDLRNDRFHPGFDYTQYEISCPRECDGVVAFHFAKIHTGTHGSYLDDARSIDIVCKCHECGHLEHAQPPIDEEQYEWFLDRWGGEFYLPWSEYTGEGRAEMDRVYADPDGLRERLDALGYL